MKFNFREKMYKIADTRANREKKCNIKRTNEEFIGWVYNARMACVDIVGVIAKVSKADR